MLQISLCLPEYRQAFQQQSPMMLQGALSKFDAAVEKYPNCAEGMALYAQVGKYPC